MELLNENIKHYINESESITESPTPMWMTYMDAFSSFIEQSGKRLERYEIYDEMDKYPEIHLALDIISTEIFMFEPLSNTPFLFDTDGKVPENVLSRIASIFTEKLKLKEILPFAVRQSLKYGDAFYFVVRNEDKRIAGLRKIENKDIDFIEYDEIGIEPLNYYILKSKIDESQLGGYLNFLKYQDLELATKNKISSIANKDGDEYYIIPATSMIRFMNKGQNSKFFPFGESYLESIYSYWKKISLLEDSLIIYRIVRAPERRVFYIDVGKAPAKVAEKVVSQTKDEIKRRRTAASNESKELGIASSFNPLSMQEDYFFAQRADGRGSRVETLPGACLSLDTMIPLIDGRELKLKEIIEEFKTSNKVNWVYSCDPISGEIVPGKITWAGITKLNTQVLKITLDNQKTITCTPEHKFPIRDIGFVEAKDLKVGQNLIPFRKRFETLSNQSYTFEQVFDVSKNKWVYTRSIISDFLEKIDYKNKIKKQSILNSLFGKIDFKLIKTIKKKIFKIFKFRKINFDRTLLEIVISIVTKNRIENKDKVLDLIKENQEFIKHFQTINKNNKGNHIKFTNKYLDKLLKQFCYNDWNDFITKIPMYGCKIIKIETLDKGIDVGTITIDDKEELHNFHTFAISSGVFTKNSNLGEISDINYFYKKLIVGMRVPSTYFNFESPPTWNDGKVGSALAEEARFGKWLTEIREQYLKPFKILFLEFLKERGINLQDEQLIMKWRESINVAENQELEKMIQRQSVFTGFPPDQFAPTYLQKKVLGWSDEEIQENITQLKKWSKIQSSIEGS